MTSRLQCVEDSSLLDYLNSFSRTHPGLVLNNPKMFDFEATLSTFDLIVALLGATSVYVVVRCISLLYFHPLSRYLRPKIAAVSNIWYACHW
ncbi:hypothetical protein F4808DRAFT_327375 [Astrocystis sublimbata]|nr:hypothetical protein F4808DRAFT_327375 [Astrocystis sublimbata]